MSVTLELRILAVFSGKSRIWLILCSVTMAVFTPEALKGVAHLFLDLMVKSSDLLTSVPPLPEASLSLKYLFPLHIVCLPLPEVSPHIPQRGLL